MFKLGVIEYQSLLSYISLSVAVAKEARISLINVHMATFYSISIEIEMITL